MYRIIAYCFIQSTLQPDIGRAIASYLLDHFQHIVQAARQPVIVRKITTSQLAVRTYIVITAMLSFWFPGKTGHIFIPLVIFKNTTIILFIQENSPQVP
jgi:hypothetical protein